MVLVTQEEPNGYRSTPPSPETPPRVLVLEEHNEGLYNAVRVLTAAGYTPRTVSDAELAATRILAGGNAHFLLLTAQHSDQPLVVPQLIERLRQRRYERTISYCAKGSLLPTTRAAYEVLTVNHVLVLPEGAQRSVLNALAWLAGQIALDEGGLTILET